MPARAPAFLFWNRHFMASTTRGYRWGISWLRLAQLRGKGFDPLQRRNAHVTKKTRNHRIHQA
jgi:hypothetical protein